MAQNGLIARAARRLLDVLALLLRGVGALCAALGSFVLFAWENDESGASESEEFGSEHKKVVQRELSEGRY